MTRRPTDADIQASPDDADDIRPHTIRHAFAAWTSGVTVVSVRSPTGAHGLTVSAFLPLSLHPPLVLVSLAGDTPVLSYIEDAGRFVVNVLTAGQRAFAGRFADRFPIAPGVFPASGDPVLPRALAVFRCDVEEILPAGDHRIVIGRVTDVEREGRGGPLVFHDRGYRTLPDA